MSRCRPAGSRRCGTARCTTWRGCTVRSWSAAANTLSSRPASVRVEGEAKGRVEGLAAMFTDMLLERFGTPSEEITARIAKASPEHLRLWGKRILTAASMAEVFKD